MFKVKYLDVEIITGTVDEALSLVVAIARTRSLGSKDAVCTAGGLTAMCAPVVASESAAPWSTAREAIACAAIDQAYSALAGSNCMYSVKEHDALDILRGARLSLCQGDAVDAERYLLLQRAIGTALRERKTGGWAYATDCVNSALTILSNVQLTPGSRVKHLHDAVQLAIRNFSPDMVLPALEDLAIEFGIEFDAEGPEPVVENTG